MKPFCLWKLPVMLLGLGSALLFTPACKAQSEVAPDHFDLTDSWQAAATQKNRSIASHQSNRPGTVQAQNNKAASGPSLQLTSAREGSQPARQNAVAIQDKRKTALRKSDKK